jgi:hypothetical protein
MEHLCECPGCSFDVAKHKKALEPRGLRAFSMLDAKAV